MNLREKIIEARQKVKQFNSIKDKNLLNEIEQFMVQGHSELGLREKAAYILYGDIPKCVCGRPCAFIKGSYGYYPTIVGSWRQFCSKPCATAHTHNLLKETLNERYGVDNPSKVPEFQAKRVASYIERYGVDNPSKVPEFQAKKSETLFLNYGVECAFQSEEIRDKIQNTNLERYGTIHPSQSDEIKAKIKNTNLERYGVEWAFQSDEIQAKIQNTNLERYGVDNPSKVPEFQAKKSETLFLNYGVLSPMKSSEIRARAYATNIQNHGGVFHTKTDIHAMKNGIRAHNRRIGDGVDIELSELLKNYDAIGFERYIKNVVDTHQIFNRYQLSKHLNMNYHTMNEWLVTFNMSDYLINRSSSNIEYELSSWLHEIGIPHTMNDRKFLGDGRELDIIIPDYKLAIEINGIYWHSLNMGVGHEYHVSKTDICESKGFQLLHLFDVELMDKLDICKSLICAKMGVFDERIHGRKCVSCHIPMTEARDFMNTNHLQGHVNASIYSGLYYNNELVAVMTLGKNRFAKSEFELLRFATKLNTQVIGGLSKLIKYNSIKKLTTYANRRYSTCLMGGYKSIMKIDSISKPTFWVLDKGSLRHRLGYTKSKLKQDMGDQYDDNKTAMENLLSTNKLVIYDCGNIKYTLGD